MPSLSLLEVNQNSFGFSVSFSLGKSLERTSLTCHSFSIKWIWGPYNKEFGQNNCHKLPAFLFLSLSNKLQIMLRKHFFPFLVLSSQKLKEFNSEKCKKNPIVLGKIFTMYSVPFMH